MLRVAAAALSLSLAGCGTSGPSELPFREAHYTVEGGVGGWSETLDVWSDGRLTLHVVGGALHRNAPPEQIERLRVVVQGAEFRGLRASYVPEQTCCDRRRHVLTVVRDGHTQRVETLDGAGHPAVLDRAIGELRALRELFVGVR